MSAQRPTAFEHGLGGGDAIFANVVRAKVGTLVSLILMSVAFGTAPTSAADAPAAPLNCSSADAAKITLLPCMTFVSGGNDPTPVCCDPLTAWESSGSG